MKLRSTLLFAAASLTASALAPVAFPPAAYGAGETISINFASGRGAMGGNWNDTTEASGTVAGLKDSTGTATSASVVYSAGGTWGWGPATDNVLKGYFDDHTGGNPVEIRIDVANISYLLYDVTVLVATDTASTSFTSKTINGVSYYGVDGVGVVGTQSWGASHETVVNANNSFTVSGLSGDLSVSSNRNGNIRGSVAGIIITNIYEGAVTAVALNGVAVEWADTTLGSETWMNSTAEAGAYAAFNLAADSTVNVTGTAITTDAITVAGTGTVTFSGNTISLIGPSVVRTESDSASIVINNTLNFDEGGAISGNVSFGESGKLSVSGGTLSVNTAALLDNISVSEGASVNFTTAQKGKVELTNFSGAGTLGVTFSSTWDNNSGVSFDATKFTGTVSVLGGNFTLNAMSCNDTLLLSEGVNMQLSGGTVTFSKNLVLNGTTEVHQNQGANLTFDDSSSLSGSGTYVRRGSGTLTVTGNVDLGGFSLGTNNGTTNISSGSFSVSNYNQSAGTANFTGTANIDRFNQTGGTFKLAGALSVLAEPSVSGVLTVRGSGKMTIEENATLTASWVSTNTGGTITQTGGTVTAGGVRLHDLGAGAGDSTYNLSGGVLNITGSVKGSSNEAGVLIGHWGGEGKGILNVSGGVLNAADTWAVVSWDSPGEFNVSGGEVNIGGIVLRGNSGNAATFTLSGDGRLNLGKDGLMTGDNNKEYKLNGGTLGALDSWGTTDRIELGGNVTVDTQSRVVNSTGVSTDGGVGKTISLGGVLSGEGSITKVGAGTLVLSGTNTYTGGTTVSAGTLIVENTNALGSGDVTINAGASVFSTTGELSIGGKLTAASGSNLVFDVSSQTAGVLVSTTGTISGITSDQVKSALYLDGVLINQRAAVNVSSNEISFSLADVSFFNLTWNGGENGVWKSSGAGWKNEASDAIFESGDSATFGADADVKTVVVGSSTAPDSLVIAGDYTFSGNHSVFAKTVSVAENSQLTLTDVALVVGESITLGNGVKLSGNGKVDLGATAPLPSGITEFLGDRWTGTIALSGRAVTDFSFDNYAVDGSFVEVSGLSGWLNSASSSQGTVILKDTKDGISAFTVNNGASTGTYTFSGSISGDGTLEFVGWGNYSGGMVFDFAGDVSKWTGSFKNNKNHTLALKFSGDTRDIGVNIDAVQGTTNIEFTGAGATTYSGVISGAGRTNLTVSKETLVWTGLRNQSAGDITVVSDATLDVSSETGKLYSGTVYSNGKVLIQGTLKVRDYGYGGSLGNLKTNGDGTEIVIIDGGTLVFTNSHETARATIVNETGGFVLAEAGVSVVLTGNEHGSAFTTKGGTLTFGGDGNITLSGTKGIVTGAAGVVKDGTGTLTFSGTNTYTGGTTVNEGILKVTQDLALGATGTGVSLGENGTLEFTYADFSRVITGSGTLVKSSSDDLEYNAGEFSGSFDVRSGSLAVTATKDKVFKSLAVSSGATFKANQSVSFATIDVSGTLSGENSLTSVSVASGVFSGTLSSVTLVKTGDGMLDLANAKFVEGGTIIVEAGTASNLALTDGGTLQLSGESAGQITLSNFTLGTGTIIVDELFDATTAMATISGTLIGDSTASLTLDISGIGYKTTYALFTFDDTTKSAWETIFGTLTNGKFNNNLVLSGGVGTTTNGIFSWNGNTLCFYENRDAKEFTWLAENGSGTWNFTDDNWNQPPEAFVNNMTAIFSSANVAEDYYAQEKNVTVSVEEEVRASSVVVNIGANGYLTLEDKGGTLKVANGISVESGSLNLLLSNAEFYTGAISVAGKLILTPAESAGELTLENVLSGTGIILYSTAGKELSLSGDRTNFTGILDVDAGTVVLENGTGTEAFSKIDIAEGATVSSTGGTTVGEAAVSTLTLGQVAGEGTLRVKSQGKYLVLDLTGSEFTGTVELDAADMVFAANDNEKVSTISKLANATTVRLTNGAALNFFNTASTFTQDIEVSESNGSIRVFGNNPGATLSGDISGAGTLTIKDGGKLILSGAVGTADSALGGLTLSSGTLEISGENSSINVSGNVSLTGTAATINTTGTIAGNLVSGAWGVLNPLTLGGDLSVGGNMTFAGTGQQGRVTTILDNAKIVVAGTTSFEDNESLVLGENAVFDSSTITTSQWGFVSTLGAGATLSAGTLTFGKDTDSVSGSAEGDASRIEIGTEDGSGTLSGTLLVKDVTFGVREGATAWSSSANLKLNGGSTTFEVGETEEIILKGGISEAVATATGTEGEEGYVAATSSTLIKTGAGTLVLEKANENKGGTEINEGTLKFTNASGVSLGAGVYTFGGGKMSVGANTTLSVGAGTTFSGNAILTSERSGKYLFTDDFSHDKSFTLDSGATVEIADGKTLTLSDLRFTGTAASKINGVGTSGTGVLAVNGKVSVENNRESSITSDLTVAGNTEVSVVSGGILKVTSAAISADGNTLTKTGAGTLTFGSDAINGYDGSFAILGGTVDVGTYMLSISGENSLTLQNATLKGTLELKGTSSTVLASAALGGGKSTIDGNVSIANTALTFGGKVTGIKELTWGDGNTVTLTDAFRATFSGKTTLIDFESAVDADGNALTAETKFENVFKQEIFLGRDVELLYNETDTTLDITVTGSLQWNGAAYWVAPVADTYQTWDERQLWDEVTKNGVTEQSTVYQSGKFVEFTRSGSMTYVGANGEGRFDGNGQLHVSGDGALSTAGMIFNIDGGTFRLSAASAGEEDNVTYSYLQGVERTIDGETKLVDDGVSILSGTITFEKGVDNRLTGGMRIFGGELWVAGEEALGDGTITLGDSAGETAAKLGFNGNATLGQQVIIGNNAAVIDVAGRISVEISNALEKEASATTAALTKSGAGTLTIQRTTALDGIKVAGGKLSLAGDGSVATELFEVGSGATLEVVNNTADGADSTFKNLVLNGTLAVAEKEAFRAGTISVTGTGTVNGSLLVGAETSFEKIIGEAEDGTAMTETVYGTALDVAAGAGIVFNGNVASYGSDAAALYKFGSGSLTLKGSSLDADFVHTAGTVVVANNLTASKLYSVDGSATVQVNTGLTATFNGGFVVEDAGSVRVRLNMGASAVFNGFSAAEGSVTFSGTGRERVSATINDNADAVALGDVMIGGLTSNNYFVDLTVDAATASAGVVALGAGSTLKLANESGDVTAEALVVEYYEGFNAKLDLSSGATLKLENSEDVAVLAGAGTLEVIGGTLSVKGQNYNQLISPKILLDGSTFNFEVAGESTAHSSLSAISTTKNGGAVSKSGSGTLVLWEGDNVTPTADMEFAGTIAADEGDLRVYATMSKADVSIAESGRLTTLASAQLGSGVEGMNTLAKTLSGTGELVAIGTLHANGGLDDFDGKLVAGGISGTKSGYLYVYGATEKWLSSDVATRGIALENGGTVVSAEEEVTLKAVSLQGDGWLYGDKMTVGGVAATANSSLTLSGTGTLGTLVFADAAEGVTATNTLDLALGDWTLNDSATNLSEVSVGFGMLTVAKSDALASADVSISEGGVLKIAADGTYTNAISFDNTDGTVWATGSVNLTGNLSSGASANVLFVAGEEGTESTEGKAGTLTLSEVAFDLATNDITFNAANGKIAVNTENAKTFKGKLAGAGTFEKAGAGTLTVNSDAGTIGTFSVAAGTVEFNSSATIAAYGETDGLLSIAKDASATINGANLSEFVLSGEGAVTVNGGELAGMKDAKTVSLAAGKTLSVSGDVSGSALTFGDDKTKLATTGAGAQTVSDTTLSGATVTLVNENADGSVVYNATLDGTTKLVLSAEKGITGGEFAGAYSGSLEKTEGGKWTVSDYTYGANGGETLNVAGGTLEWKNAKLGANAGTITLGTGATLSVNGLASGDTLSGTVSGDNTTTLEIANSSLTLGTEAAANSAWSLSVSGDNVDEDIVTITKALPGSLKVDGATAKFSLGNGSMEMGDGEQLIVAKASKLELATGTLSVANSSVEKLNTIEGAVTVASGSTFEQKSGIRWNTGSTLDIAGTYSISVGDIGNTGWNKAKVTGSGTLEVAKTSAAGYNISGDISGFAGTLSVAAGAKVNLTDGASFESVEKVVVNNNATFEVSHNLGGELNKLSGTGTVVVNADSAKNDFYNAVYSWGAENNDFTGTVDVNSGTLALKVDQLSALSGKLSVSGDSVATYSETAKAAGAVQGAFLKVVTDNSSSVNDVDTSIIGQNGGLIFSGGKYVAGATFGTVGNGNLYVVEKDASLTLAANADVNGSLFVTYGSELTLGGTVVAGTTSVRSVGGNNAVSGDFTLNGKLVVAVTDANADKTLLNVGGITKLATGKQGPAEIEIDTSKTTSDVSAWDFTIVNNYKDTRQNLDEVVKVTVMGREVEVSRDGNGNIVVVSAVNDYAAPSGLQDLYSAIRSKGSTALWTFLKSDRANAETMDRKLVGLSPVSYGSLVEMQSGFVALENDLLRDRLEQRRYERAFVSNSSKQFKPFVNILGSERDGKGNGTKSANYDISHAGAIGGFDVAVSRNTIFGVSLGFDWAKANLNDGAGKHEGDSTRLGVYGMSVFDNAYFGYGLSTGATSFDMKRNSGYNGETLTGSTDGNDVNASVLFGAGWTIDEQLGLDLAPYIGFDLGYAYAKSFSEEGGKQTALEVDKVERWSLRGKLGATLSLRASDRLRISLDASLSHEFLDSEADIDAKFASGDLAGTAFSSTAYLMDETTIQIGPRVDYRIDDTWSVSGGYSYETDLDDTVTHSANVGVRARF